MQPQQGLFLQAKELGIRDPPFNGINYTNRVLAETTKNRINFYCPAYLHLKIKNFVNMEIGDLKAEINCTIVYIVNFKGIPIFLQEYLATKMVLRFNRSEALVLDPEQNNAVTMEPEREEGLFRYTVRKNIATSMDPNIFLSPFQIIDLIMSITSQSVILPQHLLEQMLEELDSEERIRFQKLYDKKNIVFKFNFMDYTEQTHEKAQGERKKTKKQKNRARAQARNVKISCTEEGSFGIYHLAEKMIEVEYSNKNVPQYMVRKKQKQMKKPQDFSKVIEEADNNFSLVKEFNTAHFIMPLYKQPFSSIVTIFLPLWLLSILNLGVFFQGTDLADRIASLSGLLIAFVALIPTIRQELPPNPKITLVEWLIYAQSLSSILCFIQSIQLRNLDENNMLWYQNGLFMTSMLILYLQFLIVIGLVFRYFYQKAQVFHEDDSNKDLGTKSFNFKKWANHACDKHFQRKIDASQIKTLQINLPEDD